MAEVENVLDYEVHGGLVALVFTLNAGALVLSLLLAMFVYAHRVHKVMLASSLFLASFLFVGAFLAFAYVFALNPRPRPLSCTVQPFFLHGAIFLGLGAVIARSHRIVHILRDTRPHFSDRTLVRLFLIVVALVLGYCALWVSLDPPVPLQTVVQTNKGPRLVSECSSRRGTFWHVPLVSFELLAGAYLVPLAVRLTRAPSFVNESHQLHFFLQSAVLTLALVPAASNFYMSDPNGKFFLRAVAVMWNTFFLLVSIFLPKLMYIWGSFRAPFDIASHAEQAERAAVGAAAGGVGGGGSGGDAGGGGGGGGSGGGSEQALRQSTPPQQRQALLDHPQIEQPLQAQQAGQVRLQVGPPRRAQLAFTHQQNPLGLLAVPWDAQGDHAAQQLRIICELMRSQNEQLLMHIQRREIEFASWRSEVENGVSRVSPGSEAGSAGGAGSGSGAGSGAGAGASSASGGPASSERGRHRKHRKTPTWQPMLAIDENMLREGFRVGRRLSAGDDIKGSSPDDDKHSPRAEHSHSPHPPPMSRVSSQSSIVSVTSDTPLIDPALARDAEPSVVSVSSEAPLPREALLRATSNSSDAQPPLPGAVDDESLPVGAAAAAGLPATDSPRSRTRISSPAADEKELAPYVPSGLSQGGFVSPRSLGPMQRISSQVGEVAEAASRRFGTLIAPQVITQLRLENARLRQRLRQAHSQHGPLQLVALPDENTAVRLPVLFDNDRNLQQRVHELELRNRELVERIERADSEHKVLVNELLAQLGRRPPTPQPPPPPRDGNE